MIPILGNLLHCSGRRLLPQGCLLPRQSQRLLFNEDDLTRLKRKGFHVSTYREEKPPPTTSKENEHQSPRIQKNIQSSSSKEGESRKTSSRVSRASSPRVPDSTSSKKSSHQEKCSPKVKEQLDKCDTKDHSSSSKHKDRSHSDKSSRRGSDKESSSTACKRALSPLPHASSAECPKGPHVDDSSCTTGKSSCTSNRSPSRSMNELKDHRSFTMPTSSSTPNKLRTQPCHHSSSTDSRCSMMPLDMGLYSSFSYYGPPGFGRGENTPAPSVWVAAHFQQHVAAPWTDFPTLAAHFRDSKCRTIHRNLPPGGRVSSISQAVSNTFQT